MTSRLRDFDVLALDDVLPYSSSAPSRAAPFRRPRTAVPASSRAPSATPGDAEGGNAHAGEKQQRATRAQRAMRSQVEGMRGGLHGPRLYQSICRLTQGLTSFLPASIAQAGMGTRPRVCPHRTPRPAAAIAEARCDKRVDIGIRRAAFPSASLFAIQPAKREAARAHRVAGQQRVIEAAESQAHHEDHRQREFFRDIGHGFGGRNRRQPAARAFHQHQVRRAPRAGERAGDALVANRRRRRRARRGAATPPSSAARDSRPRTRAFTLLAANNSSASSLNSPSGVFTVPAATGFMTATRSPLRHQRARQRHGDQSLADAGVRAGDEESGDVIERRACGSRSARYQRLARKAFISRCAPLAAPGRWHG